MNKKGLSAEEAQAIAQKWVSFTDLIISEKTAALDQRRDVDFEQHRSVLEDLLDDYPCVRHIFWQPFLSGRTCTARCRFAPMHSAGSTRGQRE